MKAVIAGLAFVLLSLQSHAQAPSIAWQKFYPVASTTYANSISPTLDGGYVTAGFTFAGAHPDLWMSKLTNTGILEWQRSYGGTQWDEALSVIQTSDGGYIAAGISQSDDGDVTGHHGSTSESDYWIVKVDSAGTLQWQKSLGGSGEEKPYSIIQTRDGGYVIAGYSETPNDGDVTGNHTPSYIISTTADYWIVKLDGAGNLIWQRSLGGNSIDKAFSIMQTADGGYAIAGESYSKDGDVTPISLNTWDSSDWIVKLDSTGAIQWQKSYGGTEGDVAIGIIGTIHGGYIVVGGGRSTNGDQTGYHPGYTFGNMTSDYWVVKLDNTGTLQWERSLGGIMNDFPKTIVAASDGGYIIAGNSYSRDGDVTAHHGDSLSVDIWVVKLSDTGAIVWQRSIGGGEDDNIGAMAVASDGGYVIAGRTTSTDGDVVGNPSYNIFQWIVKLGAYPNGINDPTDMDDIRIFPNPASDRVTISMSEGKTGRPYYVMDVTGRSILTGSLENRQTGIDLHTLSPGIYYINAGERSFKICKL